MENEELVENEITEEADADAEEQSEKNEKTKKSDKNAQNGENGEEKTGAGKKKLYTELWFILTVCGVVFALLLTTLILVANSGGLTLKNMFGGADGELDFINGSLSDYVEIEESDYKNLEIEIPFERPGEAELEAEIDKLRAQYRGEAVKGDSVFTTSAPIKIGDDINISYLGYQTDEAGRKFLVEGASNYENANTKRDRFTVGLNSEIFGVGFEESLVGKKPNGKLDRVRGDGSVVKPTEVIYATISFVLDNGLVYDEVDVCIDPLAENFESCWGIDAYEQLFYKYTSLGQIYPTGDDYVTLELPGGGDITYTSMVVNYITSASVEPITVESRFTSSYSVESLRNQKVYFDVYIENTVEYNVPEFDDSFVENKLKLSAEFLSSYDGETLSDKCKSYYMKRLNDSFDSLCKSYAEEKMWQILKTNVKVKLYPQNEIDRVYLGWVEGYDYQYAEANAGGAGYESFDEFMVEYLELGEGGDWTSVLLARAKDVVKERLISYAVLRMENDVPTGAAFDAIYEAELLKDYEYSSLTNPGAFESFEEYKEYVDQTEGVEYKHTVYYYYATEKLMGMITYKYN